MDKLLCIAQENSIQLKLVGFEEKTVYSGGDVIKICLITAMFEFITLRIKPQLYIYGVSFINIYLWV